MRKPPVCWRPEWDALVGTMPNLALAKHLNVAHWTVIRHVALLGVRLKRFAVSCADCGKALKRKYVKKEAVCGKCRTRRNYQKCRVQKILASRAWRKANKERSKAYFAAWRERHRAHVRKYNRRWNRELRRMTDATLRELPCDDCGMCHTEERRAAILRRMLPCHTTDVHEAWSCIWGPAGREHRSGAGAKMLSRDLQRIGASTHKTRGGHYYLPQRSAA